MKEVRFEYMRPGQILEAKADKSIAYLPVSPIEWHGPHNPMGIDGLHAYATALEVARRYGGVVMPPVFAGLAPNFSDKMLENMGFTKPFPEIEGMDFPNNSVPSMYWKEEVYNLTIREHIRLIMKYGYKLIVIVTNHGNLRKIAHEVTLENPSCLCINASCIGKIFAENGEQGHATRGEQSIVMYLWGDYVDFSELPSKEEVPRLKNIDYAIIDQRTFEGNPNEDFTVEKDPRDATAEMGKEYFESGVQKVLNIVREAYKSIV